MRFSSCFVLTTLASFSIAYAAPEHERRDLLGAVGAQVDNLVQADASLCLKGFIFDIFTGSCVDAPAPESSSIAQQPMPSLQKPHSSDHHAPTSVPVHQEPSSPHAQPSTSKKHDHSSHWEDDLHPVHSPTASASSSPHQPVHDRPHHEKPPPPLMPEHQEQPPIPKHEGQPPMPKQEEQLLAPKHEEPPPMPAPEHNICTCPPPPSNEKQDDHHHDASHDHLRSDKQSHEKPDAPRADDPKKEHKHKDHEAQDAEDELQIRRPNADGSCSGRTKKHPTLWLCIDADFDIENDLTISTPHWLWPEISLCEEGMKLHPYLPGICIMEKVEYNLDLDDGSCRPDLLGHCPLGWRKHDKILNLCLDMTYDIYIFTDAAARWPSPGRGCTSGWKKHPHMDDLCIDSAVNVFFFHDQWQIDSQGGCSARHHHHEDIHELCMPDLPQMPAPNLLGSAGAQVDGMIDQVSDLGAGSALSEMDALSILGRRHHFQKKRVRKNQRIH